MIGSIPGQARVTSDCTQGSVDASLLLLFANASFQKAILQPLITALKTLVFLSLPTWNNLTPYSHLDNSLPPKTTSCLISSLTSCWNLSLITSTHIAIFPLNTHTSIIYASLLIFTITSCLVVLAYTGL